MKSTIKELVESMTGFDEIAVENVFRKSLADMSSTLMTRAVGFIALKRDPAETLTDTECFRKVMNMTLKDVSELFAEEPTAPVGDDFLGN